MHARREVGENSEIISKSYLSPYLLAISGLLQNGDQFALKSYVEYLQTQTQRTETIISTGNAVVDEILNHKYFVAQSKLITMEFSFSSQIVVPIPIEEFVVLITNILDNAINASTKTLVKRIFLKLSMDTCGLIFSVKNSVEQKVEVYNNQISFRKHDLSHGFGLQNVQSVLKKYGYTYEMFCDDNWFQFTTILN